MDQTHDAAEGMRGKVCLITGASSGIGKQTAVELARLGATVCLVARDRQRGEAARAEVRRAARGGEIDLLLADLAAQAEVRRLAREVTARYARLHILINNAGLILSQRRLTPDGLETTFAVNYLAPFLLTNLLLDRLTASAPARIITVSSAAHFMGRLRMDDLQGERSYREFGAYAQSKLAVVLFTYALAQRLSGTGVTAVALHPGVVASQFAGRDAGLFGLLFNLARPFYISPHAAAQALVHLATAPELAEASGVYFDRARPARSAAATYDRQLAERLWDASERLTGLRTEPLASSST